MKSLFPLGTIGAIALTIALFLPAAGAKPIAFAHGTTVMAEYGVTYARLNYLAKRWNREASQANVFIWGGIGSASTDNASGDQFAWNAGIQLDYETRRIYSSLKSDLHETSDFSHRIDTLQLGLAPYEHDYDDVTTWFVVQGRRYTGEVFDGTEWAFLLRLFKANKWVDVGATTGGKLQAMFMFNF